LGEPGFEVLRGGQADLLGDGPNLYAFVGNDAANEVDALGLNPAFITKLGAKLCKRFPPCKKALNEMVEKLSKQCGNIKCKFSLHTAHHTFGGVKKCHLQLNCFLAGRQHAGKGLEWHFPLPDRYCPDQDFEVFFDIYDVLL
jgi:hypothetical protein